jgi:mono/diheme cytochrome c family protein
MFIRYSIAIVATIMIAACGNDKPTMKYEAPADGKALFKTNCSSCHNVKVKLVGPALAGVNERWPDKKKLHDYIHNSQAVIKTDAYAKSVFEANNKVIMTPFPNLTDDQIDAILKYVAEEEK